VIEFGVFKFIYTSDSMLNGSLAHPQVVGGGDGLQIWRIAAANKGLFSLFGVGWEANNSSP
jgi:hypothetical protein